MMRQTWSIHSTNPRLESEMLVIAWGQEQKIKVVSGRSFPCEGSMSKDMPRLMYHILVRPGKNEKTPRGSRRP